MTASVVACTKCQTPLANEFLNTPDFAACPSCGTSLQIWAFPALHRSLEAGTVGEKIQFEGEASCFYHPQKRATVPCEGCGRFLCPVCDVELSGQHLCPVCIQSGVTKGKLAQLETKRTMYDSVALIVALGPLLVWPLTLLSAPVAIYFALLARKRPGSLVRRTRVRTWVALVAAAAQLVGWAVLGVILGQRIFE